ncbi:phosphotransferase [Mucilaginibacter sp. BT774]|uniref:phosphotransferase n=1 Tax=Mucilaginibacter sp. BT774 TaxID=3062276 RepID=UPI0026753C43|nr:phosphotransferase [Mucilaginibacter sp. BT774]MDO3625030.1 phosphotransferase [Mucilaginibacter sp. BT774]
MKIFPVTNSTLSATQLGLFLQDKYKLDEHTSCDLLKTGINHSYLLTSGADKYVFRVYSLNWRSEKEIEEEIGLLNLLKENGIPVSYPIADANGSYIQEFAAPEGKRYGVMFSFARGEKLLNFPTDVHYKIGGIMAEIHRLTLGLHLDRVTYSPDVILVDSFEHLKRFTSADTNEMAFMTSAQKYLLSELEQADVSQIRKGAVHLDIWFDNLSIDENGEVTLFDFDFCGNGWLCYDIAYYILQINSTEKDGDECRLKTEAFLDGYESITKITDEEKRLLPMLGVSLYFFYLGIQCQRFDNWSNTFLSETYLKRFINLLVKKYFDKNNLGQ